ncbi:hypothetical protein CHLRE_04g215700v5 [Chlamydomonas reinhardtii]|uniref:Tyrosine-protein kinase ephrin type A/B receptor-like domain-containing protein n=1 Tax=Chlamydomonas reinhardtii TaxID=3055 RepID=A0A2K3DTR6_CHLRE|nr:uncharacterized protein CHLRE_04g215700v5 [Chlamydomonas reinhardtii]PNW83914.1 hypothetical protein CHLRE_04g215700v5 [Chlamydomonas reinhardtii]
MPCARNTYRSAANASSACLPCPRGWTSDIASGSCTICPAGYLVPTSGIFAGLCVPCAKNTFSSVPGFSGAACQPCPALQFAFHGSTSCAACPPGRFIPQSEDDAPSPEYVGDCVDCKLNTYSDQSTFAFAFRQHSAKKEYSWDPPTCEPCPEGYYGAIAGATTCSKCPFGSTSRPGATSCFLCPAGSYVYNVESTYSSQYGKCKLCPRGTFNPTPGFSGTTCRTCPPGSISDEGAAECQLCPVGTYTSAYGNCNQCPRNTFAATPGTVGQCTNCPSGSTASAGASQCEVCPAGSAVNSYGYCETCPRGTYNPTPGRVGACSPCPTGQVSINGSTACAPVPPGFYLRAYDGTAQLCPIGTYSDTYGTQGSCKDCPTGTTTKAEGARNATYCKLCPAGKYINDDARCVACPADTYSDAPGSTSCKSCPPRYAAPEGSSHPGHCRLCPPGRFFAAGPEGQPEGRCLPCPRNTFSNASGLVADTCSPCPSGTTSEEGADQCTPCPAGSYVRQGVQLPGGDPYTVRDATCVPADKGFYTDTERSLEQLPCPVGSTTTDKGSTECTACSGDASGSIQEGVSLCLACDPISAAGAGTCTAGSGRISGCSAKDACEVCPAGTIAAFAPDMGRDACVPCPRGSISATPGSTKCSLCPAGSSTDRLGSSACTPCKPGYFSAAPGGICAPCPPGTFAAGPGATTCSPCAAATTHFLLARTTQSDCRIAHVPGGPGLSLTETITSLFSANEFNEETRLVTTSKTTQWTPARTVTAVPGGAPVPAPPGFTRIRKELATGLRAEPVAEADLQPPEPTLARSYQLFKLAAPGGGGGSTTYAVLVAYGNDGFKVCQAVRADGVIGKLALSCERVTRDIVGPNGALREAETLKLVET